MLDINLYENGYSISNEKESKLNLIYLLIVFILITSLISFMVLYKYPKYIESKGMVKEGEIVFVLNESLLNDLLDNYVLVNNEEYKVKVISLDEPVYDDNYVAYYNVKTKIDIDNKYLIDNNIIDFDIYDGTTTLYEEIVSLLKGE